MSKNTSVYLLAMALLVLIGFAIALSRIPYAQPDPPGPADQDKGPEISSITVALEHQYVAGANMFSGTLTTPTPCDQVVVDAEISTEDTERITLLLSTESTAEVCAHVVSEKGFTAAVPSSPGAELVAVVLNGQRVNFDIEQD